MSLNRRFTSILVEAVSQLDAMSSGPAGALTELQRDKDTVRCEIQKVLDRYAVKHGIPPDEARRLSHGYIDDLVGDLFVDREEDLERAVEEVSGLKWSLYCTTV